MIRYLSDLSSEIANLGKINDDENRISKIIENMVNKLSNDRNISIHLVREGHDFTPGEMSFMFACPGEIHYSSSKVKEIKKAIINGRRENYNPNYNDITYAFYLINSICHEVWHCQQEQDIKEGNISKNIFFNALSLNAQNNSNYINISYLERYHEGEAYGKGIEDLFQVIEQSVNISPYYSKVALDQLKEQNFFSKNINFAKTINLLNQIPFVSINNGFESIIDITSQGLMKMSEKTRENAFKTYPQLAIAFQQDGLVKNPVQLMEQYFNKEVTYCNMKCSITEQEKKSLEDIYLYALLPQLTPEIYEELSNSFGNDNMKKFLSILQKNIGQEKKTFIQSTTAARKDISFINDQELLQGIDENYIANKGAAGINYLCECEIKIESCLSKKEEIKK